MSGRHGLAALVCCVTLSPLVLSEPAEKHRSFAAVLQANFTTWDANQDGQLSPEEVGRLVTDRSVKGEAAAAVAAMHHSQRGKVHHNQPLSRQFLLAPAARDAGGDSERPDLPEKVTNFSRTYASYLKHINQVPHELFHGEAPSLTGFHQGRLGDCYFLSAVGAAVARDAGGVKRWFHPRADGSLDLVFPHDRLHVPTITDAEIALGSTAGQQGLWLNYLEKGFGLARGRKSGKLRADEPSIDVIDHGGSAAATIEFLTGHHADHLALHGKNAGRLTPARLRAVLLAAQDERRLVCCGTGTQKTAPGIATNHSHAVLGYDPQTTMVHVWNPWGNHFEPKGDAGLEHGYPTKGGHFDVPLQEFMRVFAGLSYETRAPQGRRR